MHHYCLSAVILAAELLERVDGRAHFTEIKRYSGKRGRMYAATIRDMLAHYMK